MNERGDPGPPRTFARGMRVRVFSSGVLTVVGRLNGTVEGDEPGRPGYYRVRLDGAVKVVGKKRMRLPGKVVVANGMYLQPG